MRRHIGRRDLLALGQFGDGGDSPDSSISFTR